MVPVVHCLAGARAICIIFLCGSSIIDDAVRGWATEVGLEFQSKFHCHAQGFGIIDRYSKPTSLHLSGKNE